MLEEELGKLIRQARTELGWTADQCAKLYGEALRGEPITRRAWLRMESGYLPSSPERRLVIEAILGLRMATLLNDMIPEKPDLSPRASVDPAEYQAALIHLWQHGYKGQPEEALRMISKRLRRLHTQVLYSSQQVEIKQLICGFQIRYAQIAREIGLFRESIDRFNKAIQLAHESGFTDLEAAARQCKGSFYFDIAQFGKALPYFQQALTLDAPPQLRASTLGITAFTMSKLALTQKDMAAALALVDEAETLIGVKRQSLGQVELTKQGLSLFRARTFTGSPVKRLHSPEQAASSINELGELGTTRLSRYKQLECNLVLAQINIDTGI